MDNYQEASQREEIWKNQKMLLTLSIKSKMLKRSRKIQRCVCVCASVSHNLFISGSRSSKWFCTTALQRHTAIRTLILYELPSFTVSFTLKLATDITTNVKSMGDLLCKSTLRRDVIGAAYKSRGYLRYKYQIVHRTVVRCTRDKTVLLIPTLSQSQSKDAQSFFYSLNLSFHFGGYFLKKY